MITGKTKENNAISLTEELLSEYSVINHKKNGITLVKDGVKYNCKILYHEESSNTLHLKVNGHPVSVVLKKDIELLLEKIGINTTVTQTFTELKAPMPGIVHEILVKKGDTIKKDDALIVLEAMKMENVLTAPVDCIISSIEVKTKETVEKNTLLIKFDIL